MPLISGQVAHIPFRQTEFESGIQFYPPKLFENPKIGQELRIQNVVKSKFHKGGKCGCFVLTNK